MMDNSIEQLKNVLVRRDKLQEQGKTFHPDTPKDLQVAIDTFFIHCKNMIDYKLDFIPGEALADLCEVLAKYPKYHHIAHDLATTLDTDYNVKI